MVAKLITSLVQKMVSDPFSNSSIGVAVATVSTLVLIVPNVFTHIRCFYLPFLLDNKLTAKTSEYAVDSIMKVNFQFDFS